MALAAKLVDVVKAQHSRYHAEIIDFDIKVETD